MLNTVNPSYYRFEDVNCYGCGSTHHRFFTNAQEDLTGRPGCFSFVRCRQCGLVYQNPRLVLDQIKTFYDDEYIAHRKKKAWGLLTPLYNWAMEKHDREKEKIVAKYIGLHDQIRVLDVGCAAATFLLRLHTRHQCQVSGVDFIDLSGYPGFDKIDFHHGLFYEQEIGNDPFDLITMWHFLEHDYDPMASLKTARSAVSPGGRIIIEVPRLDSATYRLYRSRWPGLQAPQHTVLFTKNTLLQFVRKAGLKAVDYLPYGAFPAYFYLFAGLAFTILKGKGLNLDRAVAPYFTGQLIAAPLLLFEKHLNLAMQTVVCSKD